MKMSIYGVSFKTWSSPYYSYTPNAGAKEDPEPPPDYIYVPGTEDREATGQMILRDGEGAVFAGMAHIEGHYVPVHAYEGGPILDDPAGCFLYISEINEKGEEAPMPWPDNGSEQYSEVVPFQGAAWPYLEMLGMTEMCRPFQSFYILYTTFKK
jgi:hypothetical protein